jgi:hypothetical protein
MDEERAPEHFVFAVADIEPEDLPAALSGDAGGDHDRFGGDQAAAAHVEVGGIQEHVRVAGGIQPSAAEPVHFLIETGTDPGDLGLGDPGAAEGDNEIVDVAGGHPVDPGFHDHRVQSLVDPPSGLEHGGEERPGAELRNRQLDGAGLGHQLPRP